MAIVREYDAVNLPWMKNGEFATGYVSTPTGDEGNLNILSNAIAVNVDIVRQMLSPSADDIKSVELVTSVDDDYQLPRNSINYVESDQSGDYHLPLSPPDGTIVRIIHSSGNALANTTTLNAANTNTISGVDYKLYAYNDFDETVRFKGDNWSTYDANSVTQINNASSGITNPLSVLNNGETVSSVLVNSVTADGAATFNMPAGAPENTTVTLRHLTGNVQTNNITLSGNGANIDGVPSRVYDYNGFEETFVKLSGAWEIKDQNNISLDANARFNVVNSAGQVTLSSTLPNYIVTDAVVTHLMPLNPNDLDTVRLVYKSGDTSTNITSLGGNGNTVKVGETPHILDYENFDITLGFNTSSSNWGIVNFNTVSELVESGGKAFQFYNSTGAGQELISYNPNLPNPIINMINTDAATVSYDFPAAGSLNGDTLCRVRHASGTTLVNLPTLDGNGSNIADAPTQTYNYNDFDETFKYNTTTLTWDRYESNLISQAANGIEPLTSVNLVNSATSDNDLLSTSLLNIITSDAARIYKFPLTPPDKTTVEVSYWAGVPSVTPTTVVTGGSAKVNSRTEITYDYAVFGETFEYRAALDEWITIAANEVTSEVNYNAGHYDNYLVNSTDTGSVLSVERLGKNLITSNASASYKFPSSGLTDKLKVGIKHVSGDGVTNTTTLQLNGATSINQVTSDLVLGHEGFEIVFTYDLSAQDWRIHTMDIKSSSLISASTPEYAAYAVDDTLPDSSITMTLDTAYDTQDLTATRVYILPKIQKKGNYVIIYDSSYSFDVAGEEVTVRKLATNADTLAAGQRAYAGLPVANPAAEDNLELNTQGIRYIFTATTNNNWEVNF